MSSIIGTLFKSHTVRSLLNSSRKLMTVNSVSQREFTRNLWYMCNSRNGDKISSLKLETPTVLCSCGCGKQGVHSKCERELVEFLTEEILNERKAQRYKNIPTELEGFKVSLNGAEMILTKKGEKETIKVQFNVNHTVDADVQAEINPNADKPELGELKSKPSFKVDLIRNKTTMSMLCSYIESQEQEEGYNDLFGIDEITLFEGEWHDRVYAIAGDVLDTYLYDLLMNYLEEKGIGNEFAEKLIGLSTAYEHASYVSLLEGISKFASGN